VSDATFRVDRAVLEIHHAVTAGRAKPQVTGPDEFSAPTGSGPYAASSSTAPSSGTAANSNGSYATTSSTTTPTVPTGRSNNAHPRTTWSLSIDSASQSVDIPAAPGSSTSTAKPLESPRPRPGQLRTRQLRRAHSAAEWPEANSDDAHRRPECVSGTHKRVSGTHRWIAQSSTPIAP
jgi:hypothetical protein